jgi:hypothetical protein
MSWRSALNVIVSPRTISSSENRSRSEEAEETERVPARPTEQGPKVPRPVGPAPALYTLDRDYGRGIWTNQNSEIEYPVLTGPCQFLTLQKWHIPDGTFDEPDFRDRSALGRRPPCPGVWPPSTHFPIVRGSAIDGHGWSAGDARNPLQIIELSLSTDSLRNIPSTWFTRFGIRREPPGAMRVKGLR